MINIGCLSIKIVKSFNKDKNIDLYTKKHYTRVSYFSIENAEIILFLKIISA